MDALALPDVGTIVLLCLAAALAGWVANRIDPAMQEANASIEALDRRLPAPRWPVWGTTRS